MNEKLSLKLLNLIQITLLLVERSFGRGERKRRVPAGLRGLPVLCRLWGLEILLDEAEAGFRLLFHVGSRCRTVHGGVSVL